MNRPSSTSWLPQRERPLRAAPYSAGSSRQRATGRRAFTVIEVLIVVGVVVLLLSILIVATNKAVRASQSASTRSLMNSIRQGLVQFKEDVGYYPPVLDPARGLLEPPIPDAGSYAADAQDWFSITSMPDYLVGYGPEQADGHGQPDDPTRPAPGIRSPGRDGVWGAAIIASGAFADRNAGAGVAASGQVFGPYIDLRDERLMATVDSGGTVRYPGDPGYDIAAPGQSGVMVDYWGTPIRYYRRPYPPGALGQSYRVVDRDGDGVADEVPTLIDVYVLRPWEVAEGQAIDARFADADGDTTASYELGAAEFGLLSAGADKQIDPTRRRDLEEFNRDNVIQVGP